MYDFILVPFLCHHIGIMLFPICDRMQYVKTLSEMTEAVRNTDEVCWQIRNNEQPAQSDCPVFIPDALRR